MPETAATVILRLGSHSEKEYVEKTIKQFDGVMVGANLLQATPGATATLLFKLNKQAGRPYYVDPMTYAFGSYLDPDTGRVRSDLDWIKSDKKVKGKPGSSSGISRVHTHDSRTVSAHPIQPLSIGVERSILRISIPISLWRIPAAACWLFRPTYFAMCSRKTP